MMNFLSDNTAIATLLALTLLVLLLLGVVVWAAMKGAGAADKPAAPKERRISTDSLRQSFRVAVELIESNLAARAERYNLNWTLVLNEGTQGHELPLTQSGLPSALSADSTLTASGQGISWNFFDQGVAIQLQTSYLGAPDPADGGNNSTWDTSLGLCRSYRPDRPFDGIVLALPATMFLDGDGQDQADLAARAKAIHRRLWLAQNRLALRFPLYIAIAGCEAIPGFARFAAALPEPLRRSMLGWSSPYELSAPFQGQWVDTAMNEIVRSLSDAGAELCALEPAGADSSDYFLLPSQAERLRAGLKLFTEELMRPSAYHEPFLLRGIYLTGDCSDAAVLAGAAAHAEPPARLLADDMLPPDALPATLPDGALEPVLDERAILAPGQAGHTSAVPAFLRDVFERKIFVETGLVRSASSQRMRRPAVNRALRWTALVVPAVWVVGLGVGTARLDALSDRMVDYLHGLNRDPGASLRAGPDGGADPARGAERAKLALKKIESMEGDRMASPFMPGSWPWFDGLHDGLRRRVEQDFAENAFGPLRRASNERASRLTGVPLDRTSGTLIADAQCALPQGWARNTEGGATALNLEDLPELGAMQQYLDQVEQHEALLRAMARLASREGTASGEDLALVVHTLLGADLNGNPAHTAALFRQVAQKAPAPDIAPLRMALACSYDKAVRATMHRLFAENGLLTSERQVGENVRILLDAGPRPADPGAALLALQRLRTGLRVQEGYMAGGKGAWMHGATLGLGAAWDNVLQRTAKLDLLGTTAAEAARKEAETGFLKFQSDWDAALASDRLIETMGSGIQWSDTSRAWSFADDRKALLDGLMGLLGQPYMKFAGQARLPEVPTGATVAWDAARLDQALALGDARKRFQAELLPKFPAPLQGSAAALADTGLVDATRDLLAQSYFVAAREMPAPPGEAGRARALRLRAWLEDLGAGAAAEELNGVLVKDALSRLQVLDEQLAQAQVFVPRDRAFRGWMGDKAPLVEAFGAADAVGLNGYVAQQQSFIEAVGKEADTLLLQIGGAQASNPLVMRWQAMAADLQRYRLKSPTSSLVALEQFVLGGAAEIDIGNCLDKLSARAAQRRGSDLFAERMQMLQAGLYTRCRELSQTGFDDAWNRFATAFNRDLSNRSPFRPLLQDASFKSERAPAADVEEVGAVLKLFERVPPSAQASGRDAARPSAPVNLKKFDEQMQAVRDLLGPLYPAEDGQSGGLDVGAEFRVNQAAEVDGNKIIEWSLTIGSQTLRQRDAARPLRWEPGMPVVLTLRLAQDGPTVPRADAAQPDMAVEQRTVTYRFDDPWALLSFVSAHRDGSSAARSQLLRFEFPTNQVGEGGRVQVRDARAKVFVRLVLSAPGKRAPLAWPSAFPVKVPTW